MKVTTYETLYHEDHGATLKHKCVKRIVTLPLLSFSLIFLFGPSLIFSPFFCPDSQPDLWGNHSLHHPFLTWDNALIMNIITLLFTYNSRITTRYLQQNMTLYECLRRCTRMCNESRVTCMKELWKVALPQIRCQYMIMQGNMTMKNRVIINGTVESCMAIYLGMAMEMP